MLGPWRCSGDSNEALVKNLCSSGIIKSETVEKAMLATDRGHYAPSGAYSDSPQYLGYSATISAPHMHAHAVEELLPVLPAQGARVLDVGCGSGYLTAVLARVVGASGRVYGMDYIPELVAMSEQNIEKDDPTLLNSGRVALKVGDGWRGIPEAAPFDAIHVGAAASTVPLDLVAQLRPGGRMIVPVGPEKGTQFLCRVDRKTDRPPLEDSFTVESLLPVVYVPLVQRD